MATVFSGLYSLSSAMLAFLSGRNRTNKPPPPERSSTDLGLNSTGRRDSPSSEAAATFHNAEGESAVQKDDEGKMVMMEWNNDKNVMYIYRVAVMIST